MNPFVNAEALKMMNLSPLMAGVDAPFTTVEYCYRFVPWFRRAVSLRANAVANMPYKITNEAGDDVTDIPEMASFVSWFRSFRYMNELGMTLYGAGYHILEANRFNLNLTPRYVPTPAVNPQYDGFGPNVVAFGVSFMDIMRPVPAKNMVWTWEPNPFSEREPGPPLSQNALAASGMLAALDAMATNYFRNGGVPITAVKVPPTTPKGDRKELENWFSRVAVGFRNAWKFITVNQSTEFEQVGANIREMMAPELTSAKRDDVAVAFEVPPTVIDGTSANHATANSEMLGFYLHTAIPRAEYHAECYNARLFARFGLRLEMQPRRLNMLQLAQLMEAQTLKELTGKPIMTRDEAREWLELDPWNETDGPEGDVAEPGAAAPESDDMKPDADPNAPGRAVEITDDDVAPEQAKSWLRASLANLRAGKSAAVGTPWDGELLFARTGRAVRSVYENHWPRRRGGGDEMAAAISRAADVLEVFNNLAMRQKDE